MLKVHEKLQFEYLNTYEKYLYRPYKNYSNLYSHRYSGAKLSNLNKLYYFIVCILVCTIKYILYNSIYYIIYYIHIIHNIYIIYIYF